VNARNEFASSVERLSWLSQISPTFRFGFSKPERVSTMRSLSLHYNGERIWLPADDYFLKAEFPNREIFYPVTIAGYRRGPDAGGSFVVTIRTLPDGSPPRPPASPSDWAFIPSSAFLLGDRQNPREPHYVWLPAFFIGRFEVTNAEFAEFLREAVGYAADSNWTEAGRAWRSENQSQTSAALKTTDAEFYRFGQPDQPVTRVNWFEAHAIAVG
jgi:formylglycine-generating enzyme required for sulfatase activity